MYEPGRSKGDVSVVDCIRLKEMTLFARLGVTAWEKEAVQKVSVDVDLHLDLSDAAREDSISAALDYQEAYDVVQHVGREKKYHLIESLAHEITVALISRFDSLERVTVRVRKSRLPFDAHLDCVEVELERSR